MFSGVWSSRHDLNMRLERPTMPRSEPSRATARSVVPLCDMVGRVGFEPTIR